MQLITMNNGKTIPAVGFGVFMINDSALCKKSILTALEYGCRHIDTAQIYKNENEVGAALQESAIPREEIFLTTKIWPSNFGYEKCKASIQRSLNRLQVSYIDLVLLHRPYEDYIGAWKALEEAVAEGKIRSIGLSNFNMEQVDKILKIGKIVPVVNQVECHPYEQQSELRKYIEQRNIKMEAWYPIGHGSQTLLTEQVFKTLSEKYGKSCVQIILKWHLQIGNIIFPKSTNPAHIKSNMEIFDFELTEEEMTKISQLDQHKPIFNQPDWLMKLMVKFNKFQNI